MLTAALASVGPGWLAATAAVALLAGAVAAVAGFGIGSLLTPRLALLLGTRLAIVAVSVPHLAGTALRWWRLRAHVDRRVLLGFGLTSAAGGLAGALLNAGAADRVLAAVFGGLLVFAGVGGLTGFIARLHFEGRAAWVAGLLSGLFGGMVGNQGSIRTAALLAFPLERHAFVATATAIGLLVDGARMPVYLWTAGRALAPWWPLVAVAVLGVAIGTLAGGRLLRRLPDHAFRRTVSVLLLVLGITMLARAL